MCKLAGEQQRTKPLCVLFPSGCGCFPRACSCLQDTGCTYCPSTTLPLSFHLLCWGTLVSVSWWDFAGCGFSMLHPPGCRSFVPHPPAAAAQPLHSWHIGPAVMSKGLSFVSFTDISCKQGCSSLLVRQVWQAKQAPTLIPCSLGCTPWVSHPFTCTQKLLGSSPT